MKINGVDVELAECVVAVDGSAVWVDGVVFRPDPPCCRPAGEEAEPKNGLEENNQP